MGRIALVIVSIASFVGMFVSIGSRQNLMGVQEQVGTHQHEILARNAALAGLSKAEQRLSDNFGSFETSGTFDDVDYVTSVQVHGTHAVVQAVGTSYTAAGEPVRLHIRGEYQQFSQPSGIASEAPPFLGDAIIAQDDMLLNGNVETDVCEICVDGTEALTLNANMRTNGNLHVQGNSALVRGFGLHAGTGTANPHRALRNTFRPRYNPDGGSSTQQVPAVSIPSLNIEAMTDALFADQVSHEDVTLSGNHDFGGTRENPYVWHIKGNLTCAGGARLDGYVMLIVEGSATFNGNLEAGGSPSYDGADESSVAFYVTGDVNFGGNIEVWGQIFTGGDIWFNGTPDVYGSLTSRGGIHFGGTVDVFYRKASPALTTFWNGNNVLRIRRLAYAEW